VFGPAGSACGNAVKRASEKINSRKVFGHGRKKPEIFRVRPYARISTQDQQTIPLQMRAMREYATRRGWTIVLQVRKSARCFRTRPAAEPDRIGSTSRNRCRARAAFGPVGTVIARSGVHARGVESSRCRVRVSDRSGGSSLKERFCGTGTRWSVPCPAEL
jgi:hypothetical protein